MTAPLRVTVVPFARLRELLGFSERRLDVAAGATVASVWEHVAAARPDFAELTAITRFAKNGALVDGAADVYDGDEVALLPPVGGG